MEITTTAKRIVWIILLVAMLSGPGWADVWFNQASSTANINHVSSGTTSDVWYSTASGIGGSWMDTSVLTAGGSATVLCANNKSSITINVDINIGTGRLSTATEGGTAGGGFTCAPTGNTTRTITANILAGATPCLVCSHAIGTTPFNIVAINGKCTGGSTATPAAANGVNNTSTGKITVTVSSGNALEGGTGSGLTICGLTNSSSGPVEITGDIIGGSSSSGYAYGLYQSGSGTTTVTGNITGGSTAFSYGVRVSGNGNITFSGTQISGGSADSATGAILGGTGYGTLTYTTITGGTSAATANGLGITSTGAWTISGGNLINTSKGSAIAGACIYNPGATNYIRFPAPGSTTKDYYYDVPTAANTLSTATTAGVTGTYMVVPVKYVRKGILFGASSALKGSYSPGTSGGMH